MKYGMICCFGRPAAADAWWNWVANRPKLSIGGFFLSVLGGAHAVEAGFQNLRELVGVAGRRLIGGNLHHEFQVAFLDVQIAFARS